MRTLNGDLVIVLPGILGSRLRRDGRETWGFGQIIRNLGRFGSRLTEDLSLASNAYIDREDGAEDGTIVDGIMGCGLPAGLAAAIPGFWALVGGYDLLLARLNNIFDAQDVIIFPYDWRQSNRVSARRLQKFVEPLLRQRRSTQPSAQLIFIAHSMGGLVARYYAECLDVDRLTARIITIATPYQGSIKALLALANGAVRLSAGPFAATIKLGELLRTLPSVAELLPTYSCFGSDLASLEEIGNHKDIPGLPLSILEHSLTFHREIAAAVAAHGSDRPLYSPILCHRQSTPYWASVSESGLQGQAPVEMHLRGDGTVSRTSAIPPEWADRGGGTFVNGKHSGLQQTPGTWEQIHGILTGTAPRRPMAEIEELIVDAPEYVAPGERWSITAKAVSGAKSMALVVEVTDGDGNMSRVPLRVGDSGFEATLQVSKPGLRRWQVTADPMSNTIIDSISDVFVCADP